MYTSAAVLNSCNAGASSRSRADDREYYYDLFYSLLEEGGRRNPRLVLAGGDAAAGGGGREAEPAGCCPLSRAWKIAIRVYMFVPNYCNYYYCSRSILHSLIGPNIYICCLRSRSSSWRGCWRRLSSSRCSRCARAGRKRSPGWLLWSWLP